MQNPSSAPKRYFPSLLNLVPLFFVLLLMAGWLAVFIWASVSSIILALVIFLLVWFGGLLLAYLGLINTWIEIREEGLFIQRGIIAKNRSTLLYSQIQDVSERQGLLQMIMGLKSLKIVTMTLLSASAGNLPAFENKTAAIIRSGVLEKISSASNKKAQKGVPAKQALAFEPAEQMQKSPFPIQVGKAISSGLPFAAAAFLVLIALAIIFPSTIFILAVFFLMAIVSIIAIAVRLSCTSYFTGKTRLEIQYKLFSFYKLSMPYEKIQDFVLAKTLPARLVGIADLHIETGAAEIYDSSKEGQEIRMNNIPALLQEHALQLRESLAKAMGFSLKEAMPALVSKIPLEGRKPLKKTVSMLFFLAILFVIACILSALAVPQIFSGVLIIGAILLVVLAPIKFVYEIFYLRAYYYNLTGDCMLIRKGVFNIKEVIIPFERIQNVFVDQDIFDRIFGLWDAHVSTVTFHSMMEGHIDGLSQQNARIISDMLLGKIKAAK